MKLIVLDTETTGLYPNQGDRVVEIGCVVIEDRKITSRHFHCYLNPERDMPEAAFRVHGLSHEFLAEKPLFSTEVDKFLAFIKGSQLIIHNANFDVGFLNAELARCQRNTIQSHVESILDTLVLARQKFPQKKNTLNALCQRFGVSIEKRKLHGALLDAQLLAEVYLHLTGGQQSIEMGEKKMIEQKVVIEVPKNLMVIPADELEMAAHDALLLEMSQQNPPHWSA